MVLWDTHATVSLRDISARVERFTYRDRLDDEPEVSVLSEVRINGSPQTCGFSDVTVAQPVTLNDLAAVCAQAANLLSEARSLHGNPAAPVSV